MRRGADEGAGVVIVIVVFSFIVVVNVIVITTSSTFPLFPLGLLPPRLLPLPPLSRGIREGEMRPPGRFFAAERLVGRGRERRWRWRWQRWRRKELER